MSRLMQRLKQMEAQADPKRRAERESHALAGDGLEMAARCALEAWQERPRHPDESDVFRLGYRLACHELALVFRAMRKGEPPSKAEFEEVRRLVFEDAAEESPAIESPVARALRDPSPENEAAALASVASMATEDEEPQYCSMHGQLDGGFCVSCSEQSGGEETEE